MKILYPIIDGEITGGNMIALRIIEEALKRGYEAVVSSPTNGKFTDILREKGIKVYNIDTRHSFRFDNALKFAHIIKKENVDLAHSHTSLGGTVSSRLGGWLAGVPVITHAHMPDYLNRNFWVRNYQILLNFISSRFFRQRIIAVCEAVKKEIINQAIVADKITVIYNGVDLNPVNYYQESDKVREEFGLRENQRIVGIIGRLCKNKGQHILIKAAQEVLRVFPDTVFMIVGEDLAAGGKYEEILKQLVDELGWKDKIIFTGYRHDIIDLMHTFDIVVLPSEMEGLSIVILEAMAAKRAVITTPVGGNLEIVVDKQTGTIVPAQDPDKLAGAIIYHLENPDISKRMGEEGYRRIKEHFSLSQMLDKIMDIYREVLVQVK